jgi:hypothetical protein
MREELSRFVVLFDRLVQYTEAWLDRMDPAKLDDWMPIENPSMRFGDRVGRITVKGLIVHTIVGEQFWVRHIRDCAPGAEIPIPKDPDTARRVSESDFRAEAKRIHPQNLAAATGPAWGYSGACTRIALSMSAISTSTCARATSSHRSSSSSTRRRWPKGGCRTP